MGEYSPTRTHASWKPRVSDAHVPYFRCSECGTIVSAIDGPQANDLINDGERSLINVPAYANNEFHPECCGKPMERLNLIPAEDVEDKIVLKYTILGGMNNNAIEVTWNSKDTACKPRWIALKTFTGVMMKYVMPKKWPPIVFALADEDAFAYCDKDPCIKCTFRCKRGMELYAYVETLGLVNLPLDVMVPPGSATFDDIMNPIGGAHHH